MYRIRFHGRGGQGVKTASRILGTALFNEGYEVQDAPRYGAERRGAPIFAYVRASRGPIHERGIIDHPDLIVLVDDSLMGVAAAGVTQGADGASTLLVASHTAPTVWSERLNQSGAVHTVAPVEDGLTGVACVGAAARLIGLQDWFSLERAIAEELGARGDEVVNRNSDCAKLTWEAMAIHVGAVKPSANEPPLQLAEWIELGADDGVTASPTIHGSATSVHNPTGLWRTVEPVIREEHCHKCSWICSSLCPDNAIVVADDRRPQLDLQHCKGCMICAAQCPHHAIELVTGTDEAKTAGGPS